MPEPPPWRIPGQMQASPSDTRGGSRMLELGTYGSERGARGNSPPYRDHWTRVAVMSTVRSSKYRMRSANWFIGLADNFWPFASQRAPWEAHGKHLPRS